MPRKWYCQVAWGAGKPESKTRSIPVNRSAEAGSLASDVLHDLLGMAHRFGTTDAARVRYRGTAASIPDSGSEASPSQS